ncbi:MAG: hypothetical protein U5L45_13435 [Saprospiraceae bacterium]|nr:hypothetical protein [Saprospiraceae bacterium]
MVYFSVFARKMNHIPPFRARFARAKSVVKNSDIFMRSGHNLKTSFFD